MKPDVYHFIAIGGVGQSALAKILLQKGCKVSGSDIAHSKYVQKLKELGAKIFIGHKSENVPENAVVVLSSAVKQDNPELTYAKAMKLKIIHRSDLLKIISEDYPCFIGFSGTHGKTTTSGMCAYVLDSAGKNPSYAIGGIVPEIGENAFHRDDSEVFVAELDESDGTILKYHPDITVIHNLEADHLDFYQNGLDDILKAFTKYITDLKPDSKIIANMDDSGVCRLIKRNKDFKNFITFSLKSPEACYFAKNIVYNPCGSEFEVFYDKKSMGRFELSVPSSHNVYNALAVIAAINEAGFDVQKLKENFKTFSGMGRRFQKSAQLGENIDVIDDYAHHPTEIKAALKAGKSYTKGRLVVVFQPHRHSRLKGLWKEFLGSFKEADLLIVTDVWAAGEQPSKGFDSKEFVRQFDGCACIYAGGSIDEAAQKIAGLLETNDTVMTVGAGDITKMGGVLSEFFAKFKKNRA